MTSSMTEVCIERLEEHLVMHLAAWGLGWSMDGFLNRFVGIDTIDIISV